MSADYFNNPLMPFKWYVVACTREKCIFKKIDVFMYLSMTHDNAFELLYVSVDEINRRLTKCYHGKFIVKKRNNYLIIRQGLWRKKLLIVAKDDDDEIVALTNRWKSRVWILTKKLPYNKMEFEKVMAEVAEKGFDVNSIEIF